MSTAYDEQQVVAFQRDAQACYAEAGQVLDLENVVWSARTTYDAATVLGWPISREKHLNELRAELGLTPTPITAAPLGPIHAYVSSTVNGFFDDQGRPWIWKGATDFLLYKRFLEGEDIRPILLDRRYVGANLLRVLLMCHNITRFYPQDYGDRFFAGLPNFSGLLASYGFRWEACVFADAQHVIPNRQEQIRHWTAVGNQLRSLTTVFPELVNEAPKNGIDPMAFQHPGGLVCSRGSGLADEPPPRPGWEFFGWHGRRDWPKVTSSTEDMWYIANAQPDGWNSQGYPPMVAVHDEPVGFAEVAEPNRRSTDTNLARLLGAASVTLGAGGTFHSDDGIFSRPFGPVTRSCALAFFSGLTRS